MNIKEVSNMMKQAIINETNLFKYKDIIIIGENTSGKSKLLKDIIKCVEIKNIYFIDSKNRTIPTKQGMISDEFSKFEINEIVSYRGHKDNFNKKDVFSPDSGAEIALGELINHKERYITLFKDTLDIDMKYEISDDFVDDPVEQITINGDNLSLISSGVQSMLRILMEVDYASERGCKVIVIDEFNTNLDHTTSADFFIKLREKYSGIRFIITSHSIYTIRDVNDVDVIKIYKNFDSVENNACEFFDSNDLDNLEIIDRKLFSINGEVKRDETDILLSNVLKLILCKSSINEELEVKIKNIPKLNLRQEIIYNFIVERIKKTESEEGVN